MEHALPQAFSRATADPPRSVTSLFLLLMALLALLPVAGPAQQTRPECDVAFRGVVERLLTQPPGLVVNGRNVRLAEDAVVLDDDNEESELSEVEVGSLVEVIGCPAELSFVARVVRVLREAGDDGHDDHHEVIFHGPVSRLDAEGARFVVNGATILTDGTTEFEWAEGDDEEASFADLAVGTIVRVEAVGAPQIAIFPPPPPAFFAHRVRLFGTITPPPPPRPERFHIRGYLQSVDNSGVLVVNQRSILTDEETVVLDHDEETTISLAMLVPGDFLSVSGSRAGDVLTARVIRRAEPIARPVHFQGVISEIDDDSIVVGEQAAEVEITEGTTLLGADRTPISLDDLEVGDRVHVRGRRSGEGTVIAELVEVIAAPLERCEANFEFAGAVQSRNEQGVVVNGTAVVITRNTRIRDREGRPVTVDALVSGTVVRVDGRHTFGAERPTVVACEIRIREEDGDDDGVPSHNRLIGRIDNLSTETLTFSVREIVVQLNAETEIVSRRDDHPTTLTLSDLRDGDLVQVRGNRVSGTEFVARRIQLLEDRRPKPPVDRRATAVGLITELSIPEGFTVGEDTSIVLPESGEVRIIGVDGRPIEADDLGEGDLVFVRGSRAGDDDDDDANEDDDNDGPIVAREIRVRAAVVNGIDSAERTLQIGDYTVATTTGTLVLDRDLGPISFDDLVVGDLVRIEGRRVEPLRIVARRIHRVELLRSPDLGDDFTPVIPGQEDGEPTLEVVDNENSLGFLNLPEGSHPLLENTIFEVTARVYSNLSNESQVPTVRLRHNNESLQRASETVVESIGGSAFVPNRAGRVIRSYFQPAQLPALVDSLRDDWFSALDVWNFSPDNAANARIRLGNIRIRPIHLSRFQVEETVAEFSFDNGSEGWEFGAVEGLYSVPTATAGANGTLDLIPVDQNSLGFWTGDTGVVVQPNTLYRGRFLVRAGTEDSSVVPTFRVRLMLKSLQLSSNTTVSSIGDGEDSPTSEGRLYDTYFHIPAPLATNEGLLAAFDLIAIGPEGDLIPVSLDHFRLERLAIIGNDD
jgi:hypothetical protein